MVVWKQLLKLKSFKIHWIFEKNWSHIKKIIFGYLRAKKGKFHDFGQFSWFFAKFSKKMKTWGAISAKTKGRMKKFVKTKKFENTLNFGTHSVSCKKIIFGHFRVKNVILKKSIFSTKFQTFFKLCQNFFLQPLEKYFFSNFLKVEKINFYPLFLSSKNL